MLPKGRFGYRLGNGEVLDHAVFDGLVSTFDGQHMVQQASAVSRELGISREEQDAWAFRSQQRAAAAQDAGRFDDEIVPVGDVSADESIRRDTTLEKLASLKPVFDPEGTTTAGNAPGLNDGASCVVVCSEEWARERGIEPLAHVARPRVRRRRVRVSRPDAGGGLRQGLSATGHAIDDVSRVEINEAFASVARNSTQMLGADEERVNVNGGAVALGHPIGASGGRIVGTLVHELRRHGRRARSRGDLLGRRAGRRDPDRGLTLLGRLLATALGALVLAPGALALALPERPARRAPLRGRRRVRRSRDGRASLDGGRGRVYEFLVDQNVKGPVGREVDVDATSQARRRAEQAAPARRGARRDG